MQKSLGEQVRELPEWQFEPVFVGSVAPGKAFAVDLGEAKLPVQVELAAANHVGIALQRRANCLDRRAQLSPG